MAPEFRPHWTKWASARPMHEVSAAPCCCSAGRIASKARSRFAPAVWSCAAKQWTADGFDLELERTIVAIEGNRITVDAPVMNALDARFGGASIYRFTFPRIAECGVEDLRLVSEYEKGKETSDEAHAWIAIGLGAVENAWVRDVVALH